MDTSPQSAEPPQGQARGKLLKLLASAGLLACVAAFVDVGAAAQALAAADLRWLALALAVQPVIIAIMAWRWAFVARRLDVELGWAVALREYWSSVFLNQVLPIGIAGDAARTLRHARMHDSAWSRALLAALIDRMGAQVVLWTAAAIVLPWAFGERLGELRLSWARVALALALLAVLAVALRFAWRRAQPQTRIAIARAGWRSRAAGMHLGVGLATLALHLGALALCGIALGVALPTHAWLAIGLWMLGITSVPWFFAGWGVRELGVAGAFAWFGAPPELGAATSVAFGLVSLLGSTPGAWFVWRAPAPASAPATASAPAPVPAGEAQP